MIVEGEYLARYRVDFVKILKFRAITYSTPGLIFITADKKIKNQHFLQVSEDSASFINEPADFDLQTM